MINTGVHDLGNIVRKLLEVSFSKLRDCRQILLLILSEFINLLFPLKSSENLVFFRGNGSELIRSNLFNIKK